MNGDSILLQKLRDIEEKLQSLEHQINLVYYSRYYPSFGVFYELGLSKEQVDKLYDILDKFMEILESGETFSRIELEKALSEVGIGYQSLKSIFNAFWEESKYRPVIVTYLKDIMKLFKSIPSEYHRIWKEIEETERKNS
ncbi:hypothetical protein [Phorcysia thermohydrogeniphila]|uniref:Uncharacterized protein n=1 Tax=Phorcysia thermohydrogeniphila TaxID=936138 RepID=A0A4R1GFE7_9BACT|nr:hypothetical protein [Phorcysia thermohydrogeniphila]TCK04539.1 hypothetical protein CLV27_0972 [Phorcysia thermohydrogeniphila]